MPESSYIHAKDSLEEAQDVVKTLIEKVLARCYKFRLKRDHSTKDGEYILYWDKKGAFLLELCGTNIRKLFQPKKKNERKLFGVISRLSEILNSNHTAS